jgi:D-alanyl-D-alanine carboxypeptidase
LAGFASAKDEEYVFAIISNSVSSRKSRQDAARAAIDRMLSILIKTDVKAPTPEILN